MSEYTLTIEIPMHAGEDTDDAHKRAGWLVAAIEQGAGIAVSDWSLESDDDRCGGHKFRDYGYGRVCRDCGKEES